MDTLIGQKFYKVEVIGISGKNKESRTIYDCLCECGKKTTAYKNQLEHGHKKSCGCIRAEAHQTHGQRYHPLYRTWVNMLNRVNNDKNKDYHSYGGRGIVVCDRWKSVQNFIDDMYPSYKKGLSLDRIDTNGNYEPSNCRWATDIEQANNTRKNIIISYNGELKTIGEWSKILGIKHKTLDMRYRRGFSQKEIIEGRTRNDIH